MIVHLLAALGETALIALLALIAVIVIVTSVVISRRLHERDEDD